jgi:serine/threonine protein kinase
MLSFQADSQETLARFRREAEAVASLDHPNILPIYEVSEGEDGLPFFSMKFAAGGSLLDAASALRNDPRRSVELMAKVVQAVQYAHGHGILHRDLKPGNILLDGRGEPLVSDFGLAKWLDTTSDVTRTLTIFGTPGYIAPEQAKRSAAKLTPAADVYSLGAILFDLFTGRPPFLGEHALAVIQQASEKPAPKLRSLIPGFDRDLETICAKCLEREPNARYRSAGDLAEDLEHWLKHEPIQAKPSGFFTHARKWVRRNPSTSVLVTLLLALAAGLSLIVWNRQPAVLIPKSVAVLPFENLSPDPDNAYLADALQEEIRTRLASIADLKVISRTYTQRYQGRPRNLDQIAKQLGVANILEGSVQKVTDQVRVSVQLINAETDSNFWADTFDRKLIDIFQVESEIVTGIAESLRAKLTGREQQALAIRPTNNPEAYDAYLRGLAFAARYRYGQSPDLVVKASGFYERAVQLDPNFATAWARLCRVNADLYSNGSLEATPARRDAAKRALENAQKLAPNSPETVLALGYYQKQVLRDFGAAKTTFGRVTKMLPRSSDVSSGFLVTRREGNWEWIFNPGNGHEYRLTTGYYWGVSDTAARTRPDWFDAEDEAVAAGGHLVTINDEAENNWLVSLFDPGAPTFNAWGAHLWIGLSDFGSEGSFYWISGETANFTNWDDVQPDNAHEGGEDSVHTNHDGGLGLWNDLGAQGNAPHHSNPYRGIIERSN